MPRQITFEKKDPSKFTIASANEPNDPFLARLVKLVPSDVISVYMAVFTLINNQGEGDVNTLQWIVFGLIAVVLPFYLRKAGKIKSVKQIVICEISFLIWVFSIGGPVTGLTFLHFKTQVLAAILVPLFTLAAPWLAYLEPEDNNPS